MSKKILLAVTGSIAAYKACSVTSVLVNKGYKVQVMMSENACKFITPLSLSTLSKRPVLLNADEFNNLNGDKIPHIYYTQEWSNLFIILPATMNCIAKIANGIADDIVTTTALATPCFRKKIIFPAANSYMYNNPMSIKNLITTSGDWDVYPPESGKLACGVDGEGKLPSTKKIIEYIEDYTK